MTLDGAKAFLREQQHAGQPALRHVRGAIALDVLLTRADPRYGGDCGIDGTGVRPSSGAATLQCRKALEIMGSPAQSEPAAPEDGRTPVSSRCRRLNIEVSLSFGYACCELTCP